MSEFDEFFPLNGPIQILNKTPDAPLLAGAKPPYHINKVERPAHRQMLELAAKGFDNKEIADMMGRSAVNVNNALRQPHSQQFLVNEIRAKVSEDQRVVQVIRENVVAAVELLADTVKDTNARRADRILAAEKLLERRYGKANQPINRGTDVDLNALSDADLAQMLPETENTATSKEV